MTTNKSTKKVQIAVNEQGRRIGESHPFAVHSDADVELARQLREAGLSYGTIAEKLEMSKSSAYRICNYLNRGQVADNWKTEIEVNMILEKVETITAVHPHIGETVLKTVYTFSTGQALHRYHDGAVSLTGSVSGKVYAEMLNKANEYEERKCKR